MSLHKQDKQMRRFFENEMHVLLSASCGFSIVLLMARIIATGKPMFLFLPWNLFLAFIPYFISYRLQQQVSWVEHKFRFVVVTCAWLLFIPNSFYILTDLFHLQLRDESNRWFDLLLIFSFAWNGLLFGIVSVRQMERMVSLSFGAKAGLLFIYPVVWLISVGIYIGRYMRYNSWDIITNPFELIGDIALMIVHPFQHFYPWCMITCFAVFIMVVYVSIKRISRIIL